MSWIMFCIVLLLLAYWVGLFWYIIKPRWDKVFADQAKLERNKDKNNDDDDEELRCFCGTPINPYLKDCPTCGNLYDNVCADNVCGCGATVDTDLTHCPVCGAIYEDNDDDNEFSICPLCDYGDYDKNDGMCYNCGYEPDDGEVDLVAGDDDYDDDDDDDDDGYENEFAELFKTCPRCASPVLMEIGDEKCECGQMMICQSCSRDMPEGDNCATCKWSYTRLPPSIMKNFSSETTTIETNDGSTTVTRAEIKE